MFHLPLETPAESPTKDVAVSASQAAMMSSRSSSGCEPVSDANEPPLTNRLDSIFAEVEKNIPSIDFEISDVSSDEEVSIFQRTSRPLSSGENDDSSEDLTADAWEDLFQSDSCGSLDKDVAPAWRKVPLSQVKKENEARLSTGKLPKSPIISNEDEEQDHIFGSESLETWHTRNVSKVTDGPSTMINNFVRAPVLNTASSAVETLPVLAAGRSAMSSAGESTLTSTGTSTQSTMMNMLSNMEAELNNQDRHHSDLPVISNQTLDILEQEMFRSAQSEMGHISGVGQSVCNNEDGLHTDNDEAHLLPQYNNWTSEDIGEVKAGKPRSSRCVKKAKSHENQNMIGRYFPRPQPLLAFQNLGEIDLDAVLLFGTEEGMEGITIPSIDPHTTSPSALLASGDAGGNAKSLIEKLARLSIEQSGTDLDNVDPVTGAQCQRPHRNIRYKDEKTAKNLAVGGKPQMMTAPLAARMSDLQNLPRASLGIPAYKRERQPDTVFVDLRDFEEDKEKQADSVRRVADILRLQEKTISESSSEESEEEEVVLWHEQRRRLKAAFQSGQSAAITLKQDKDGDKSRPAERSIQVAEKPTHAQRLAKPAMTSDAAAPTATTVTHREESVADTAKETAEAEKIKRAEAARKLREEREREHQRRLRLGQQLEVLRPEFSVGGKHPAAEATPILFDLESSYEPAPHSLPADLPTLLEYTLLTVRLASNGEIVLHRGATAKSVDSGDGLSASYASLLAWLLSLVPDQFDFLQDTSVPSHSGMAPFHVIGLQQMYLDGQLCLYVAVCPTEHFSAKDKLTKSKKSKKRDELKNSSPFQQVLAKYFSGNTLQSVSPWLANLVSQDVAPSDSSDGSRRAFVYRPPLPNITSKPLSTFIQINPDPAAVQKVLAIPPGFLWHTIENDDAVYDSELNDDTVNYDTQNTMSLIYKKVYRDPCAMMGILNRTLQEGLDLCGIRLLYPTPDLMKVAAGCPLANMETTQKEMLNNIGPILALAIRGMLARTVWLDAVGPSDPALARRLDPNSLCAMYGGSSRDECLLFCPRNPLRVQTELARWFGGRVPASGMIDVGAVHKQQLSSGKQKKKCANDTALTVMPPGTLTAATKSYIFVTISPLVPPSCIGFILATAQRRGYQLRGVRRMRLNMKRIGHLGISNQLSSFYLLGDYGLGAGDGLPQQAIPPPATILLLCKENGIHGASSLIENFMVKLCLQGTLGSIQAEVAQPLNSKLLFHVNSFSEGLLIALGGDFTKVPVSDYGIPPGYIAPKLYTNPEMEEIVIVALTGHQPLKNFGALLVHLLGCRNASSPSGEGFELLGMKWLSSLQVQHAKELTPFELGDKEWKSSIHTLTSEPAVILALRGLDGYRRVAAFLDIKLHKQSERKSKTSLEKLMSFTPDVTYRLISVFFYDKELFADSRTRHMVPYLPPLRQGREVEVESLQSSPVKKSSLPMKLIEESVVDTLLAGQHFFTTVLIAKPDVVQRHLGRLLRRISQEGFRIVAMHLLTLTTTDVLAISSDDIKQNPSLLNLHSKYLTSRPSLVMCLERENAVRHLLNILGPSDPRDARRQGQMLWRAAFGVDPVCNGLHGSVDYHQAVTERQLFFPDGLCCKSDSNLQAEQVVCPAEDRIIIEGLKQMRTVSLKTVKPDTVPNVTSTSVSTGTSTNVDLPLSGLTQTNCVVLTPPLMVLPGRSKKPAYVDVIDHLLSNGFEVVGMRMVWMNEEHAQHLLHLVDAGSFRLVPMLTSNPCIALALQRDNGVFLFDSLLGSSFNKESIYSKYSDDILRTKDQNQACKLLAFFFNQLIWGAQATITSIPAENAC